MRLLLKLVDYCYYECKGELVWVRNKKPYLQRTNLENLTYLARKGLL